MITQLKKYVLKSIIRPLFEILGIGYFSDMTLNNIGESLYEYLDKENGFFIELGANDGEKQSNTYYLEKIRNWRGILIEPIPSLYKQAVKQRPRSQVFNCACVPFNYPDSTMTLIAADLMTIVKDIDIEHDTVMAFQNSATINMYGKEVKPQEIDVPVRTLTSILDECSVEYIDFLSLDVEGYEVEVLRGLDLVKYQPTYMLVESFEQDGFSTRADIEEVILEYYDVVEQLTFHDVLYKRKSSKNSK